MTYIYELFDLEDLHRALEDGFVRRQYHPTEPLVIYNYTVRERVERRHPHVSGSDRPLG
jgi:RNA ligase